MHKILTTLILAFSCLASASNTSEKVNLVCDGEASNYVDQVLGLEVKGLIVVIDFSKNRVSIDGVFGGDYFITQITNGRIQFADSSNGLNFAGGINRYTGELTLIVRNELDESGKFVYYLIVNCRESKKLF